MVLLIITSALFFYGCPYSSSVPISEPDTDVPADLVGKWKDASAETKDYYEVMKKSSNTMIVEEYTYDEEKDSFTNTMYNGHVSKVGGDMFLNVQSEGSYYLYKMDLSSSQELILYPLSDYIKETFSSSDELKDFVAKYKDLSFFYGAETTYSKFE